MPNKMIEVWFIRHGESEANAGLSTETPHAIQLTDKGHEQARKTAQAFTQMPALIVTSSYTRAVQTAQYAINRFPLTPVETWDVHEFNYLASATVSNTTYQERKPLRDDYWGRWDPDYVHGEGAESFTELIERAKKLDEQIRARDDRFIAVFSHGFMMKAVLWTNLHGSANAIAGSMQDFYNFQQSFDIPNCAIIKAEYHPDKTLFSSTIISHLE